MASIFLSYARSDLAKAERIAHALQRGGHSVWWDRHLHTGEHFTAEIDSALRAATAVVVLWSTESITSAWVQDEAAVGRDAGKLFPVLLDSVQPPLGFRQFQSLNLSSWSGRGTPRALAELIKAIDAQASIAKQTASAEEPVRARTHWLAPELGALLVVVLLAAYFFFPFKSSSPTLAVTGAKNGDAQASRDFAHQVALDLSRLQPADLSSLVVRENGRAPDYRAELGLDRHGNQSVVNMTFVIARRPSFLWVNTIAGETGRLVDLRQQAAAMLSAVMRCALEAETAQTKLNDSNLRLYLDGCTAAEDLWQANGANLVPTFKRITQSSPNFAPAQALLALAYTNAFSTASAADEPGMLREMRAALAKAKRIDPNSEIVFAVDSMMHPFDAKQWDHVFPILDRGLAAHPGSAILLGLRSQALLTVGRMTEAAVNARQALEQDPLSPQMRVNLINALAYSGLLEQARAELAKAEAIWPNSTILEDTRYRLDLRYGDARNALRLLKTRFGATNYSGPGFDQSWQDFLNARIDPSRAKVDAALNSFRERYRRNPADIPGYIQALGTFGRTDEAFQVFSNPVTLDSMEASTDVLFRPQMHSIWADSRFMNLAQRLGLLAYWRKSGAWPDFCSNPTLPYDCRKEANKYAN